MIHQRGMTLIECLIALALSLLFIEVLIQIYLQTKDIYLQQQALVSIQENGLLATELLRQEIQSAGYLGCSKRNSAFIDGRTEKENDQIEIKKAIPIGRLIKDMESLNELKIKSNHLIKSKDQLAISDCTHADFFTPDDISRNIIKTKNLSQKYLSGSDILLERSTKFFIRDTGRGTSLYIKQNENVEELIPGVEKMEINYRLKDQSSWHSASEITNWDRVNAVHINLIIYAVEKIQLKKQWTFTVVLRNA